jgi:hypothetical protein
MQRAHELDAESANFRAALAGHWSATTITHPTMPRAWQALYAPGGKVVRCIPKAANGCCACCAKAAMSKAQWRARLLYGAGSISLCCGDLAPAQSLLEEGLALCRARDDKWGKAYSLHRLSFRAPAAWTPRYIHDARRKQP